jgi:hypothetical protein
MPAAFLWLSGGRLMSDSKLLALASSLRARAKEILAKAEAMQDAKARRIMFEIAERYEKLAQRLDQEASD